MTNKGPIGEIPDFYRALATDPIDALKTTWRGVTEGTPSSQYRLLVPSAGVFGLGLTFIGAAAVAPLSVGVGLVNATMAGAYYHALGRDLPPPAPTGPSPGLGGGQ